MATTKKKTSNTKAKLAKSSGAKQNSLHSPKSSSKEAKARSNQANRKLHKQSGATTATKSTPKQRAAVTKSDARKVLSARAADKRDKAKSVAAKKAKITATKKAVVKTAAKVVARAIPGVGTALLAKDAYDLAKKKGAIGGPRKTSKGGQTSRSKKKK